MHFGKLKIPHKLEVSNQNSLTFCYLVDTLLNSLNPIFDWVMSRYGMLKACEEQYFIGGNGGIINT